jgi:threonine synthase
LAQLVIGTNRNDILYRFVETGRMIVAAVEPSFSPSMDIQVSSNFERLYYEAAGRDGVAVAAAMRDFRTTGSLPDEPARWQYVRREIDAHRVDDAGTRATIAKVFAETGEILDPHSAIAFAAARARGNRDGTPMVSLACAHPAKFPDVVEAATGIRPALPAALADLDDRPERIHRLPADLGAVERFITERAALGREHAL